jgi:cytosine deaminase/tRNA(adenine34) deaminase
MNQDELIEIFIKNFQKFPLLGQDLPSFSMLFENSEILSMAYNSVERNQSANQHSEVLAIQLAFEKKQTRYLENSILLTTLEPCLMCAGAIVLARVREVWYFAEQTKQMGISSLNWEIIYKLNYFPKLRFIQDTNVESTWKEFFKALRAK